MTFQTPTDMGMDYCKYQKTYFHGILKFAVRIFKVLKFTKWMWCLLSPKWCLSACQDKTVFVWTVPEDQSLSLAWPEVVFVACKGNLRSGMKQLIPSLREEPECNPSEGRILFNSSSIVDVIFILWELQILELWKMVFVVICRNWHLMWPEQSMQMAFFTGA